jgi:hypothetical protein
MGKERIVQIKCMKAGFAALILMASAASAQPTPTDPPSPHDVVVTSKKLKSCSERDHACIATVAKEVWTRFPDQIEGFCNHQRMGKERERIVMDQMSDLIGIRPDTVATADYEIPAALKEVCEYDGKHAAHTMTASAWLPWTTAPTAADLAVAYPRHRGDATPGDARIYCQVSGKGRLEHCSLSDEAPAGKGFGKAALSVAPKFTVHLAPDTQKYTQDLWIDIAVHFDGAAVAPAGHPLAHPDWVRLPDPDRTAALYPAAARAAGVTTGVGTVDCRIGENGALGACALVEEQPAGLGFGQAALAAAPEMRVNLWTREGGPAAGSHVVAPLRFDATTVSAPTGQ